MTTRRLAWLFAALPLAFYAYACSSDDSDTPEENDAGNPGDRDSGGGGNDSGGGTDSGGDSGFNFDGGTDGGVTVVCIGNPLTPDGGAVDGGAVIDAGALREITVGDFPDGPHFVDAFGGALLFSEVYANRVVRIQADGGGAPIAFRTVPGGLIPIGNTAIGNVVYTTQSPDGTNQPRILRTQLDGGVDASFTVGAAGSPNDIVGSAKGYLYFTDPPYQGGGGGVYRLDPADGGLATITVPANNATPDGVALSPDGSVLYVSVAGFTDANQRKILRYTVDANGNAANGTPIAGFTPKGNPTGMAVDVGGNLWIAEYNLAGGNSGQVEVISAAGQRLGEIPIPTSKPTGVAFGGADNKTVYITGELGQGTNGRLYLYTSRCAGTR